jgi:hypothetical protein
MPRKLKPSALNSAAYFPHDLTITPEVLAIQANVTGPGQDMEWLWTWTTSSLPYSRVNITTSAQTSVPIYKQGTYQIDNFAGAELHSGMTQTHSLYLKWIEGAGTANLVPWVTYQNTGVTASHPSINGGATTQVQRLIVTVPSTVTVPTSLTTPTVSYNVTVSNMAYSFMGSAHGLNPNIGPFYRGGTYTINLSSATGHPFYFTEDSGAGFVAGSYVDEWTSGVTNSRATSGSITFTVPNDAPDELYYQCGNHASMRGAIKVKDLAVEYNNNGNPILYFQHTQDHHVTPVELRPLPSLVNQMCVVYDAASGKFVPQDLATYIERTPSFKNKIQEVAGTATLVNPDGTTSVSTVTIYPYANYLPLLGNNDGDVAFTEDTGSLYIWNTTEWQQASGQLTSQKIATALGFTPANAASLGTLASVSPTGTANSSTFLAGDNSYKTVSVTPTAVSDQSNSSTGYFDLPAGTTAQRPSGASGMIRYNTSVGTPEVYTSEGWVTFGAALGSAANPARNALQLKGQGYASGQYYILVDGYPAYRMYVDNDRNGGGWVMAATVKQANCQDHHNNDSVRFDGTNGPTPSTSSTTKVSSAWMNAYRAQSSYTGTTAYWMEATSTSKNVFISSAATVDLVSSASEQDARTYCALTFEGSISNRDPNTGTRGFGDHHTGGGDYFAYQRHPEQGGNCGFKSDGMGSSDGYLWIK